MMYPRKTRIFVNKGGYFSLVEDAAWKKNRDEEGHIQHEPVFWNNTHIFIIKHEDGIGMEIKRFHSKSINGPWQLADNPYAGVVLSSEEWGKVFTAMGIKNEN